MDCLILIRQAIKHFFLFFILSENSFPQMLDSVGQLILLTANWSYLCKKPMPQLWGSNTLELTEIHSVDFGNEHNNQHLPLK